MEDEGYYSDSVIGIEIKKNYLTPEYLRFLLRFWKPIFVEQAPETARTNINLETLRPLKIPLPRSDEQKRFSRIACKIKRLVAQQREATRQAEHLFQTTLHRAFRGEL